MTQQSTFQRIAFVIDTTASMGSDIDALREKILPEVVALSKLIDPLMKILVLEYKDYDTPRTVTRSSGWLSVSGKKLLDFLSTLRPTGGADTAEATKTAMSILIPELDENTLVLHFADAEPHMVWQRSDTADRETKICKGEDWDWCALAKRVVSSGAAYYSLIRSRRDVVRAVHSFLGRVFSVTGDARQITDVAMAIILRENNIEHDLTGISEFHVKDQELPTTEGEIRHMVGSINDCAAIGCNNDGTLCIMKKFKSDEHYRSQVLDCLINIFTEGDIMCLTSNALFGRLWNMCKSRLHDDTRLETAKNALSKSAGKLTGADRTAFTAWQEESHNQLDVIKDSYNQIDDASRFPAYTLDPQLAKDIDVNVLLDLSRGVAKPSDRKILMKIINAITVVRSERELLRFHKPKDLEDVPYVPLSLESSSPIRPFQYLPHLLVPGMIFGTSATMQLLLLAVKSSTFENEATSILRSKVGTWIKLSGCAAADERDRPNPAHFTILFTQLVRTLPSVLTPAERRFYDFMDRLRRTTGALPKRMTLALPYSPIGRSLIMRDTMGKRRCARCHHWRSRTLLTEGDICGLCRCCGPDGPVPGPDKLDDDDDETRRTTSRFLECRTCRHFYAIIDIDALNVPPKCHYCRMGETPPHTMQCDTCFNIFNRPTTGASRFRCGRCADGVPPLTEREATIEDLLEQCPRLLGIDRDLLLSSTATTPFKTARRLELSGVDLASTDPQTYSRYLFEPDRPDALTWNGKPIQNVVDVLNAISHHLRSGRNVDECQLCFEEFPLVALHSACGACSNHICETCARSAYGDVLRPGTLVTMISCPFCKRRPRYGTLKRVRKDLIRWRIPSELDDGFWYALCRRCRKVDVYGEKECARGVPRVTDFLCVSCDEEEHKETEELLTGRMKQCPACGHGVEKVGGCAHMSCVCGAHWCWICGMDCTRDDIYGHIYSVHGGE